jgi:two-component system, NtrC family, sensor kinase
LRFRFRLRRPSWLQQQTATADVLKVISRSTFDLQLVLDTLVESAARLCEADIVHIARPGSGGYFWSQASFGVSKEFKEEVERVQFQPGPDSGIGRTLLERAPVHILDVQADANYALTKAQKLGGYRTVLCAPMLRGGEPIGVFGLARHAVRPFTERQIELLATFADQAVIAIENARLLNALRESLEQQTATSRVLDVISRSVLDLHAVFETVVESSVKLCGADRAIIMRFDGELLRLAVAFNVSPDHKDFVERNPIRPGRNSAAARAALERRTIHIPDVRADPEHAYGAKDVEALRTILGVPILKGDDLLGVLIVYHLEVRPFTDRQIALLETFADQAAIAIENVQLLDELRERTDELGRSVGELRALGEVSQAVNSTLDLETVLTTIVGERCSCHTPTRVRSMCSTRSARSFACTPPTA